MSDVSAPATPSAASSPSGTNTGTSPGTKSTSSTPGNTAANTQSSTPVKPTRSLADQSRSVKESPKHERSLADQVSKTPSPSAGGEPTETRTEAERRKYRLKVDGKDIEEELTDDQIAVRLQKGHGAERRMQEAAEHRKQLAAWVESFKKDPWAAAKDPFIGLDLEALAEEKLTAKYERYLEEQSMTEEQRTVRQRDEELKRVNEENARYKKRDEDAAQQAFNEKVFKQTESEFTEALKEYGTDVNDEVLYEMAKLGKLNLQQKLEMTPKQVAAEVREIIERGQERLRKSVTGGLKGDRLLKHLGDDVVKEVIRASLSARKVSLSPPPPAPKQVVADADERKPQKNMSTNAFRRKHLFGID